MIFTFKVNTFSRDGAMKEIKNYCERNNIAINYEQISTLASLISRKCYATLGDVKASTEEDAWEKVYDKCDLGDIQDYIEVTDVDDSDEREIEERARARYEAQLEDEAMERYYESKYGK